MLASINSFKSFKVEQGVIQFYFRKISTHVASTKFWWFRFQLLACLHDQNKVAFLEGRLLSSQSEQSEKFSKSPDWLEKSRPSKKPFLF